MIHKMKFIIFTAIAMLIVLLLSTQRHTTPINAEEVVDSSIKASPYNCRYGATPLSGPQANWLSTIGTGWYLTFGTAPQAGVPADVEFAPMIRIKQNKSGGVYLPSYTATPSLTEGGLGATITANPGALWLVGNEPDRAFQQDDTYPDIYAVAYHDIYTFIKTRDPNARVALAGLVQVSPMRLQYLDLVWDAYLQKYGTPMPVDVWNMHIYVVPERKIDGGSAPGHIALGTDPALAKLESYDPDGGGPLGLKDTCALNNVYCYAEHDDITIFKEQVLAMRSWMKDHGQQNKPLILSEFSLLYPFTDVVGPPDNPTSCYLQDEFGKCFTAGRVSTFMQDTFDYLETATDPTIGYPLDNNRLVQRWMWFSVNSLMLTGQASNLVNDSSTALTPLGQVYQNEVASRSLYTNLVPDQIANLAIFSTLPSNTADADLSVTLRNIGNTETASSFEIAFYADQALTQLIGTGDVSTIGGCADTELRVETTWNDLAPGGHYYWVKVDNQNTINESDENDNVIQGTVIVDPLQIFLPTILR